MLFEPQGNEPLRSDRHPTSFIVRSVGIAGLWRGVAAMGHR